MKVLFVASECTPIVKVGGLGDVIGSLPKVLKELGVDVRICLPKYGIIDFEKYKFDLIAEKIEVKNEKINIYQGFLPESRVPVYLLENEKYFGEGGIYFEKSAFVSSFKEIKRFLFFSQAVLKIFPALKWFPEIIHCHDWHTAILPPLAKLQVKSLKFKVKSLLTIHNLANQGKWNPQEILSFLNLKGGEIDSLKTRDKDGDFNILQQGIFNADILNTVSPQYAKEILTKEYGEGLENFLLKHKKNLFGIINGIDEKRFNPETDPDIKKKYSFKNLEEKVENKIDLQEILNLPVNPAVPFLGMINRLTSQKGIDLIIEIIPEMVKLNCQFIILGVGAENYERKFCQLSRKYPKNISAQIKFDPVLAQKIYAGCDIFLMPSFFEPCGLGQMIAQRYGTIPVIRKTGGLADTVLNKKTGFVFEEYKSEALLKCLKEALKFYQNQRKWRELIKQAMNKDFSWLKSAKEYLKLYKKLV
jgi:starch synthase